jgi:hypothetical protein
MLRWVFPKDQWHKDSKPALTRRGSRLSQGGEGGLPRIIDDLNILVPADEVSGGWGGGSGAGGRCPLARWGMQS